ncbi:5'-nucleotidase, lipoprotein e(P4) family [uncultured Mitsuokella sp.]|uniref:5'-nucleotidase, lipoprotein e(P4) family n=2 Tax=uncultured Mitsuokella sp. TaxID=453120 RepID=UPI0026DC4639|nr:5'-nucleotidase, lipoprotein e(P4) family [uncultured Mitsuokella sp.]
MTFMSKKKSLLVAAALGISLITGAPQTTFAAEAQAYTQQDLNAELTMAAAWMQNSAEYRELCYQAYNAALDQVVRAVAHHKAGDKPLAIVLDADETVLDNSAFEAGLIGTDNAYSNKNWDAWCAAAKATAMPGAAEFLQSVDKLGVDIFYVTNRSMKTQYDGSAKNMKAVGFPQIDREHMLFKTDTSNKQPRYDAVSQKYDVVVYLGDNAGDLPIGTYHKGQKERNALVDQHKAEFGHRFIALPNPTYGDWEPALKQDGKFGDYWKLTPEEKSKVRNEAMRKWQPEGTKTADAAQAAK